MLRVVWVHGCDLERVSDGSRLAPCQTLSIECVQMTLSRVIVKMVGMGAGTSALQVIDGSYACLYYSLPIQHISVPWVLHTQ